MASTGSVSESNENAEPTCWRRRRDSTSVPCWTRSARRASSRALDGFTRDDKGLAMKNKIHIKSLVLGAVTGASIILALGAATRGPFIEQIFPLRFAVLEVTPHGDPINGRRTTVLRLAPFHGKIDQKSY